MLNTLQCESALLRRRICVASGCDFVHCLNKVCIHPSVDDSLHHSQMFQVVMCVKQGVSCEELDQDATDTPDIARERPAQAENDLRSTVVTS